MAITGTPVRPTFVNPDVPQRHEYRVQACDLLTGNSLNYDLQMNVSSILRAINDGGGTMTGVASLRSPIDYKQVLRPRQTAIWVWRDEVPVWGGILWVVTPDPVAETVSIQCQGFMSYLTKVKLLSDQTFTNVEQLDIARALIDYAMGRPNALVNYAALSSTPATILDTGGSNLGITYSALASGVVRTRTNADGYAGAQEPLIMDLLTNLAGVINGFQWCEDLQWAGGTAMPVPYVQFAYPQFSRNISLKLRFPGDVVTYLPTIDGTSSVNRYSAIGTTDSTGKTLRAIRNNYVDITAGAPILMGDSGSNYNDVSVAQTLDQHAVEDLATVAGNSVAIPVTTTGDIFGKFSVGDSLQTSFTSAWDKTPFETPLQCTQWELVPSTTGQAEVMNLTMAPLRVI